MTHFLRTSSNDSVVDLETTENDLHVVVAIDTYSRLLLGEPARQDEVIADFDRVQELRGEFHESLRTGEAPRVFAARVLREVGAKYGLDYVTD